MLDTRRRRPVELASSVSDDGPFSEAAPSEPQLIPGTLATCPAECTPRPRNQRVYRAACTAAEGEPVIEFDASEIVPRMRAWCGGHFLTVVAVRHMCLGDIEALRTQIGDRARAHQFVLLRLQGNGGTTGWLIGELDTPVYCLA